MKNSLKIKIEGLNLNKILNALIDDGVYLEKVKIKPKMIVFEIGVNDEVKLKKICKRYRKKYYVLTRNILKNQVIKLKYYLGFLMSVVIIVSLFFSFNLYVYEVNLSYSSSENFDMSNITNLLTEKNIVVGAKRKDINSREIQKMILESQENVAGCTVSKNGGKLDIVIYPGSVKERILKETIVSKYNAVVTSVEIFAGKTNIKVGDIVKVNDVLIENDNGASGAILGKVYYSDYIIYNENQTVKEFTGKVIKTNNLILFNKKLFRQPKIDKNLNYLEEKCVFCVNKNAFMPIFFQKTQLKEFVYKDLVVKFENVEDDLKSKLYGEVIKRIENINTITNVTYSVVTENNLTRLDCFVECEIDITK